MKISKTMNFMSMIRGQVMQISLFSFFFLSALLLIPSATSAQNKGMSDNQVLNMVQKESGRGTQKAQIVTKLVQQGVGIDQIRRVRKQAGSTDGSGDGSRLRQANGSTTLPGSNISSTTATQMEDDDNP